MGTRLIEDFLARTGLQRCSTFAETAEVISKVCRLFPRFSSVHFRSILPAIPWKINFGNTLDRTRNKDARLIPGGIQDILEYNTNTLIPPFTHFIS